VQTEQPVLLPHAATVSATPEIGNRYRVVLADWTKEWKGGYIADWGTEPGGGGLLKGMCSLEQALFLTSLSVGLIDLTPRYTAPVAILEPFLQHSASD
jgi:hypothetical protein